jgi:hypothetical protein
MSFGDPDSTLDISVAISNVMYDFCAYTITLSSIQALTTNWASLIMFSNINFETMLMHPVAILTYHTDALFFDPISTGIFTVQIDYIWSLSNTYVI